MKKLLTILIPIIVLVIIVSAATLYLFPYSPNQPPAADDDQATEQGMQEVVNANNQFTFDFYSKLTEEEQGNIFYSPYSLSAALAMTYEGAREQTAEEIKNVFHFPETETLRPNFAGIYNDLNTGSNEYELKTGNALWIQKDYPLLEDYTSNVENYYGGKATNLDFIQETEKSRQTINSFIEEQTNNKIKDLIPEGVLGDLTRLVITNAIYFKGNWVWEFDKDDTREQDFKITPENIVQAEMMHMKPEDADAKFNYADLEKLQILELPYKGEKISMLILLPKQMETYDYVTGEQIIFYYNLEDIELSAEKLNEYKSQMQRVSMDGIYLPKFEFDIKYFIAGDLSEMGMPSAFSNADFSGITGGKDLIISQVIHQAFVKVDEEGTEAAAATAVIFRETVAMIPSKVFRADHPFMFIIQEKETGNILFLGRVTDPTQ